MLSFLEEVKGDAYNQLIEYAVNKSDAIMLVFGDYTNTESYKARKRELRQLIAPFRIKTRNNAEWATNVFLDKNVQFSIDVYKACEELLLFLKRTDRLYGWLWPDLPEDPCFFRNGDCWFATNAHEKFAYMYDTREDRNFVRELGVKFELSDSNGPPEKEDYTIK